MDSSESGDRTSYRVIWEVTEKIRTETCDIFEDVLCENIIKNYLKEKETKPLRMLFHNTNIVGNVILTPMHFGWRIPYII